MEKLISVDGKEMRMVANGATPLYYRTFFGRDVFEDIQGALKGTRLKDVSSIERLAYTLARQGESVGKDTSLEEWLASLDDPMALIMAAGDIVTLWTGNRQTMSQAKKKSGR